ncbi:MULTISPECIES: enoyl-CoA hydratase/isomerase family protein [unclassified Caballeronia]|uniref:enoyl-CoA hydratase/isomerase family protein n=1 Tax=unclassified Caballeronia TaxID=2646786 RepID=UPI00285A25B8|nr:MULTISPECIES: enoyl-CoA hydratase/isomerase family protein [unclassified Caballeronia]MDR5818628.1 enoyl-CoA hydratase/isomerase family protein [Caballeronia sp. LZ033]MDR5825683.1 enoyl-CoA hydratase/isomerase family protein [Caballeronia sp. LZ043]MDR5884026.1 enoyl-CoA hydratase/isomerase family protein [Caballeronia sp. LZ032]
MQENMVMRRHGAVAEIVINRPEKMNSMTPGMTQALLGIRQDIERDAAIRVVLLRGEGERAFSAGSDLHSLKTYQTAWEFRARTDYAMVVRDFTKPVVAALKGWVLGGGLEMMLGADIRVAGKSAKFGAPEVLRGWVGGGGASQMLPRLVGYGQAMRLLLTGDTIDAGEARDIGLVEMVVEDAEVVDSAMALCRRMAEFSPIATQSVKAAVRAALSMSVEQGIRYENELTSLCFASGNYEAGANAFGKRTKQG